MQVVNPILQFLHVAAVVFWIGGIGYILFVLMPAVPQVALRDRAMFMPIVLRRFLVVVWVSIVLLFVSGTHRLFGVWKVTDTAFFASPVGQILAFKLVLVAVLLGIAVWVTLRTVPRARSHVVTHTDDACDAYKCGQCAEIVGGLRWVLQLALGVALGIIYLAVRLGGG